VPQVERIGQRLEQAEETRAHGLVVVAGRLNLDRDAFTTCLDTRRPRKDVETDVAEGRAIGVRGTPTFLVNGTLLVGAQPIEAFREAIRKALKEAGAK